MIVGYFGFRNILATKIPPTSAPMDTTSISISIGVLIIAPTQPATGRISTGSPHVPLSKRARNLLQAAADLRE
jgi:hypothetical protein